MMISTSAWESPWWFRRQHFAKYLAQNEWNVLYVNPQKSIVQEIRDHNLFSPLKLGNRSSIYPAEGLGNLKILRTQLASPGHVRFVFGSFVNRLLLSRNLRKAANQMFGNSRYIQVLYNPADIWAVNRNMPLIYEIFDKYDAYPEYKKMSSYITRCHENACRRADSIIATTETLVPTNWRSKTIVIPNGVDLATFKTGRQNPCPQDLAAIPLPRAVYAGALLDWFDYDLLRDVAKALPNVQFVVIGFPDFDCTAYPPNVHYLGKKKQAELPDYYSHCQIGIIPFKAGDLTRHVNPLKFYEYLAAGLPCVSVPMSPLKPFKATGVLALAGNFAEFAQAIVDQIGCAKEPIFKASRAAISEAHDWRTLAQQFIKVTTDLL